MAGKAGAMHGIYQDASPFQFHEENYGEQLRLFILLFRLMHFLLLTNLCDLIF